MKKFDSLAVGYNGEHATSVNGTASPDIEDFVTVGTKNKMPRKTCIEIIDQVKQCCAKSCI